MVSAPSSPGYFVDIEQGFLGLFRIITGSISETQCIVQRIAYVLCRG